MGKIQSVILGVICAWGALAQAMPGVFQMSPETTLKKILWGPKTGSLAILIAGGILGWYMWTTDTRINELAARPSLSPASAPIDEAPLTFIGWGSAPDNSDCAATLDTSKLPQKSKDEFDVVLICGFSDPSIDYMKDTRITVSRLFTSSNTVTIETPFSEAMTDGMANAQKEAIDRIVPHPKKGQLASVQASIWMRAALLPKGFDTSNIRKLADINSNGGHISLEGPESRISKFITVN